MLFMKKFAFIAAILLLGSSFVLPVAATAQPPQYVGQHTPQQLMKRHRQEREILRQDQKSDRKTLMDQHREERQAMRKERHTKKKEKRDERRQKQQDSQASIEE
jgi:hypothetical protein